MTPTQSPYPWSANLDISEIVIISKSLINEWVRKVVAALLKVVGWSGGASDNPFEVESLIVHV